MSTNLGHWRKRRRNFVAGGAVALAIVLGGQPAAATDTSGSTPPGVALQAACWILTVPYGAAKMAYSLGGGIVGSLALLATGGHSETAEAIWNPSMKGDYIIQPQHLTGEKPLRFMGPPSR